MAFKEQNHARSNDFLRAEDGTPLEVKEGIVIDENGNQLTTPPASERTRRGPHHSYQDPFTGQRVFVWKSNGLLAPLIIAPILVILLAVGLTLFTGVAAAAFIAWIFYMLVRTLRRL